MGVNIFSSFVCALMILQSCSAMFPLSLNSDMKPSSRSQGVSELFNDEIRNNEISNDDFQKNLGEIMNNIQKELYSEKPKEMDDSKIPVETSAIKSTTPVVVKPTVNPLPQMSDENEILDQIIGSMAEHQAPPHNSEETHDNLPTTTEPSLPSEDDKNSGVVTKTKLKIKIYLDKTKNETTKHQDKQMDNKIEKIPEFDQEQYLTKLWNTSVPILLKNNKASIHPNVELKDLYQVLPEISNLLKKLKSIHKEGHVTVVMMNPKSLQVNKAAVKKSKICCELRHMFLINNSNKLHRTDSEPLATTHFSPLGENEDEQPPSEEEDIHSDDVDTPWNHNEQSLVSNVLNNLHLFTKPQHLSALSFNPRHVLQNKSPLTLLHLRIKLSSPVEIRGNAAKSFRHEDIFPEPESAEFQHSGSYENEVEPIENFGLHKHGFGSPKLIHIKFKLPHGTLRMQEIPMHKLHELPMSQDSGSIENLQPVNSFEWNRPSTPSPKVLHLKLDLHHGESFRIQDIPFDRLHEKPFAHSQPELPVAKEAPRNRPMMVFVMHKHSYKASPELPSFLKDVFQIPDTRDTIPNHEFVPEILNLPDISQAVFRHPFQDSYPQSHPPFGVEKNHHFQNSERNDFERMMESVGNSLDQMEHSTEGIKENNFIEDHLPTPPMRSFSPFHDESANLPRRFEPVGDSEDHQKLPFEIFKMFNTDGLNLFPSQGKFSDRED